MSNAIVIREAALADMPVVWSFLMKKAAFDGWQDKVEATPESLAAAFFGETSLAGVLLAEVDGRAVGFATWFYTFSTYLGRRGIWLDDLYVDESDRGRGIGRGLLRKLAQMAVEQGCGRIEWITGASNANAIRFYEGIGAAVKHGSRLCRLDRDAMTKVARS